MDTTPQVVIPSEPESGNSVKPLPQDREPISAFVICFNEQDQIAACLASLDFCDEILVIDSFSTDRTLEIAEEMGATLLQRPWPGYLKQKAFGLTQVKHDWVVNIDADERVSPELRENILRVLSEEKQLAARGEERRKIVGYNVNRVVFYLGRWWRKGGWYPEYRLRVFRRDSVVWGGVEPHEKAIVSGETAILPGELLHYTYKDMNAQFAQLHSLSSSAAKADYQDGRRADIVKLLVNPVLRMLKFYLLKKGYREGTAGLIVAIAEGYYTFMKYAKLWEYQFNEGAERGENGSLDSKIQPAPKHGRPELQITTKVASTEHES